MSKTSPKPSHDRLEDTARADDEDPVSLEGVYRNLSTGQSTTRIRLLEILEPVSGCPSGRIIEADLATCPKYVALSYVWGPPMPQCEILLNDISMRVRHNLWDFLDERGKGTVWDELDKVAADVKYFWVDALCINQEDLVERSHQVQLMGDIFSKATAVVSWLGRARDDYGLAMRWIAKTFQESSRGADYQATLEASENYKTLQPLWTTYEDDCLFALCSDEYWSRVWIVQELLLAPHVVLICGSSSLASTALASFLMLWWWRIGPYPQRIMGSAARILYLAKDRWSLTKTEPQGSTLTFVLGHFLTWKATDPRDKVYALLALTRPRSVWRDPKIANADAGIVVDYTKSTVEVYNDVMRYLFPGPSHGGINYLDERSRWDRSSVASDLLRSLGLDCKSKAVQDVIKEILSTVRLGPMESLILRRLLG